MCAKKTKKFSLPFHHKNHAFAAPELDTSNDENHLQARTALLFALHISVNIDGGGVKLSQSVKLTPKLSIRESLGLYRLLFQKKLIYYK